MDVLLAFLIALVTATVPGPRAQPDDGVPIATADRSDPTSRHSQFRELCVLLGSNASPLKRFTPAGADPDAVIDVRAVFQQGHRELAVDGMPAVLLSKKGRFGLVDYEKMFCVDPKAGDIFDMRGVNREAGCMVVVRPDQYVSHVLPLHGYEALADFFAGILVDARCSVAG